MSPPGGRGTLCAPIAFKSCINRALDEVRVAIHVHHRIGEPPRSACPDGRECREAIDVNAAVGGLPGSAIPERSAPGRSCEHEEPPGLKHAMQSAKARRGSMTHAAQWTSSSAAPGDGEQLDGEAQPPQAAARRGRAGPATTDAAPARGAPW